MYYFIPICGSGIYKWLIEWFWLGVFHEVAVNMPEKSVSVTLCVRACDPERRKSCNDLLRPVLTNNFCNVLLVTQVRSNSVWKETPQGHEFQVVGITRASRRLTFTLASITSFFFIHLKIHSAAVVPKLGWSTESTGKLKNMPSERHKSVVWSFPK